MQSRTDCIRMGLWEVLPSQLSTVQKDHHSPTYWSFRCIFLWVIFKTASLFLKTQNNSQPIYPGSENTSIPELRAEGVQHLNVHDREWQTSLPLFWLCGGKGNVSLLGAGPKRVSARTKTLTQISDYSEYLNTEVKGPRAQIILSISTLRSKTKVGTTSCDTHGLPQPCIKTSCMEAFNVTA